MSLEKLDKKFYASTRLDPASGQVVGCIRKAKDDSIVPDDEWCVFLAKDTAFSVILQDYIEECGNLGCDQEQLDAVQAMYDRVVAWREANPTRLKKPDAAGETLLP